MLLTLADVLFGFLLPAAVAFSVLWVVRRLTQLAGAWLAVVSAVAWATGTLVGYFTLQLGPILPTMDREWIPCAGVLALLLSSFLANRGWLQLIGWVGAVAAITLLAFLLVPDWETLKTTRTLYQAAWSVLTIALTGVLVWTTCDGTEDDGASAVGGLTSQATQLFCLLVPSALAFPVLALSGSLRFAMIAFCLAGGGLGVLLALLCSPSRKRMEFTVLGGGLVWAWVLSATLLTGLLNSWSSIPVFTYAALPWTGVVGILLERRLSQWTKSWGMILIPIGVSIALCSVLLAIAIAAEWEAITQPDMY